ncbi:MAG: zinc-binding dehydrogenase [Armatimonadetes bacterium]|nr:zinc-binding dehydrogenase [Armatimonadota bacterium]
MVAPTICAIPYGGISPAEACVTEPLGVAIDMSRLADIEIGSHVVVSGLGAIGLMALRLAKLSGAGRIYACDVSSAGLRLEMAKRFGADEVICADKIALQEYAFPRPPDRFLVSSPPRTLKTMFDIAAKGAILSFIGIQYGEGANLTFDANEFHFKKLQLRASFASPALYTPRAYELIRTGMVDAAALITHRFPLSQIHTALRTAACDRGSAIKVVVEG